jgi:hypothetical protein
VLIRFRRAKHRARRTRSPRVTPHVRCSPPSRRSSRSEVRWWQSSRPAPPRHRCRHESGRTGPGAPPPATTGKSHDHHVGSTANGYRCWTTAATPGRSQRGGRALLVAASGAPSTADGSRDLPTQNSLDALLDHLVTSASPQRPRCRRIAHRARGSLEHEKQSVAEWSPARSPPLPKGRKKSTTTSAMVRS